MDIQAGSGYPITVSIVSDVERDTLIKALRDEPNGYDACVELSGKLLAHQMRQQRAETRQRLYEAVGRLDLSALEQVEQALTDLGIEIHASDGSQR